MPYDINNPPSKLKNLSDKKQRQFIKVFNSCWEKHEDDELCHKMAWGAVKKSAYSVANKVDGTKASDDIEPEVQHNDKYSGKGPCMMCGAQRELLNIALDLQDIEPKIATILLREAKALR